jgi:hypothetical protein
MDLPLKVLFIFLNEFFTFLVFLNLKRKSAFETKRTLSNPNRSRYELISHLAKVYPWQTLLSRIYTLK